jgi:hypothetical protein
VGGVIMGNEDYLIRIKLDLEALEKDIANIPKMIKTAFEGMDVSQSMSGVAKSVKDVGATITDVFQHARDSAFTTTDSIDVLGKALENAGKSAKSAGTSGISDITKELNRMAEGNYDANRTVGVINKLKDRYGSLSGVLRTFYNNAKKGNVFGDLPSDVDRLYASLSPKGDPGEGFALIADKLAKGGKITGSLLYDLTSNVEAIMGILSKSGIVAGNMNELVSTITEYSKTSKTTVSADLLQEYLKNVGRQSGVAKDARP